MSLRVSLNDRKLTFWINAFIPQTVAGYTQIVPLGTHAGKTAVPLPGLARTNPLNWRDWDTGYLTDQRTFSQSPTESVRMQSIAEFVLSRNPPYVSLHRTRHISSGTTEVDMETGEELGFAVADMSRCSFSGLTLRPPVRSGGSYRTFPLGVPFTVSHPSSGPPAHEITLIGRAGDPLVSAAADIDYEGTLEITAAASGRCSVWFSGKIDAFPAFECYAQLGTTTRTLFRAPPPSGNTVLDLLGSASRDVSGMASLNF